jgi:hypothetical protein
MQVLRAEVTGTADGFDNTLIPARLISSGDLISVIYTTPFNSIIPGQGGFTAYPRTGDTILVTTTDDEGELTFYYLSTIVSERPSDSSIFNYPKGSTHFGQGNFYKDTVGIRDHHRGGVEFVYENTEGDETRRVNFVKLYGSGNAIKIDRTPEREGIVLKTRDSSVKLKMAGPENDDAEWGPNSMFVKARGNFIAKTLTGSMRISTMVEGNQLHLDNFARSDISAETLSSAKKGDIDITSWHNSVNIQATSFLPQESPKVFIRSNALHKDGVIQMRSGGNIEIVANYKNIASIGQNPTTGKITIYAGKGIDIIAETGDINISAKTGNVNLQPLNSPANTFVPETNNLGV